jgi:hypothetical protein
MRARLSCPRIDGATCRLRLLDPAIRDLWHVAYVARRKPAGRCQPWPTTLFEQRSSVARAPTAAPRSPTKPAGRCPCSSATAFLWTSLGEPKPNSSPSRNTTSPTARTSARARCRSASRPRAPSRTSSTWATSPSSIPVFWARSRTPRSRSTRRHRRGEGRGGGHRVPLLAAPGGSRLHRRGRGRVRLPRAAPVLCRALQDECPRPRPLRRHRPLRPAGRRGAGDRPPDDVDRRRRQHCGRHPPLPAHHLRPGQADPREPAATEAAARSPGRDPDPRRQVVHRLSPLADSQGAPYGVIPAAA